MATSEKRTHIIIRCTILGLSILAFVFSVLSIAHCSFLLSGDDGAERQDLIASGLFSTAVKYDRQIHGCVRYTDQVKNTFEGAEKTARAFGVLAAILSGIAMMIVFLMQFFIDAGESKRSLWIVVRILFALAAFSQSLTFSVFGNDECQRANETDGLTCTLGPAGIISVFAVVMLLTLCTLSCVVPPPAAMFVIRLRVHEENRAVVKSEPETAPTQAVVEESCHVQHYEDEDDKSSVDQRQEQDDEEMCVHGCDSPGAKNNAEIRFEPIDMVDEENPTYDDSTTRSENNPEIRYETNDDEEVEYVEPDFNGCGDDKLEYSVTREPNGKKKVTKVFTDRDGTKIITTTIIPLSGGG